MSSLKSFCSWTRPTSVDEVRREVLLFLQELEDWQQHLDSVIKLFGTTDSNLTVKKATALETADVPCVRDRKTLCDGAMEVVNSKTQSDQNSCKRARANHEGDQ